MNHVTRPMQVYHLSAIDIQFGNKWRWLQWQTPNLMAACFLAIRSALAGRSVQMIFTMFSFPNKSVVIESKCVILSPLVFRKFKKKRRILFSLECFTPTKMRMTHQKNVDMHSRSSHTQNICLGFNFSYANLSKWVTTIYLIHIGRLFIDVCGLKLDMWHTSISFFFPNDWLKPLDLYIVHIKKSSILANFVWRDGSMKNDPTLYIFADHLFQ